MTSYFKKNKGLLLFIFLISNTLQLFSQKESWETYIDTKKKGFIAITVNMKFGYVKPNYKNLLIVGTQTSKCLKNGYPNNEGLEKLYAFSDSITSIIDKNTKNRLVGILTYQCTGFDVFYVKDTLNLRSNINSFIRKNYPNYKNYLFIQPDKKWNYFKNFLFPKDLSNDFFVNHELLNRLFYEGDDLSKDRKIEYWMYFRKEKRRQQFIDKIQVLNFKVDSLNYRKGKYLPYELIISRVGNVDPESIAAFTKFLKLLSSSYNGNYDGWTADLATKP